LVHRTIDYSYVGFYSEQAIAYFKNFHSKEKIIEDAANGATVILFDDSRSIGTGALLGPEIRRVFVFKEFQGRGFGKRIMDYLEKIALGKGIKKIILCSSLASKAFYDHIGYVTFRKNCIYLKDGKELGYYDMYKVIC
jgi:GNAT superfamily N-acetyltransferase